VNLKTITCLFCEQLAVAWHHLTGRATPSSLYLDRSLVVPLCRRHHDREHELLRRSNLEFLPAGADALGHRVARILELIGRCADNGRALTLEPRTPYGDAIAGFYALLLEAARVLQSSQEGAA
jgi:hypothetical protein